MFEYAAEQRTYEISGVKIGGEPGLVPTVMVGSMFYNGHIVVEDPAEGLFDEGAAEGQLRRAEEMSDATGLPTMVDLVAENAVAAARYLNFMVAKTEMPILLDVVDEGAMVESLQYASDQGMMDRIILNSLNPHSGDRVYQRIEEAGCRNAVLLLHSTQYMLSSNKDALLEEMIPKAEAAGIENILVDTVVIDIPTLGLAAKAIDRIKDRYGYPCGCGAHNAIASWKRLKEKYCAKAVTTAIGVTSALPIAVGADYVFYGPMRNAEEVYPAIAMIDAAYSQQVMEKRIRLGRDHPRYRIG
ncbi:MAG: tetrahydromethanopterin S-methyltransferase subunit H [Candidatus Bathyarchaeota archaeon]|nr:MAG: tetrahydromethanopterin S-methyltransferase subunit H [Candidatus Bathyarchaeota archaeon]